MYAMYICQAIWYRDETWFHHLYIDCYPDKTYQDAHIAYDLACKCNARASRKGPSRPWSDISVGPKAVNREREQQLSLPL